MRRGGGRGGVGGCRLPPSDPPPPPSALSPRPRRARAVPCRRPPLPGALRRWGRGGVGAQGDAGTWPLPTPRCPVPPPVRPQLSLRAASTSRSAFASFLFVPLFFQRYEPGPPGTRCKVLMKVRTLPPPTPTAPPTCVPPAGTGRDAVLTPSPSWVCSARCQLWTSRWSAAWCCCGPAPGAWCYSCTASTVSGRRGRWGGSRGLQPGINGAVLQVSPAPTSWPSRSVRGCRPSSTRSAAPAGCVLLHSERWGSWGGGYRGGFGAECLHCRLLAEAVVHFPQTLAEVTLGAAAGGRIGLRSHLEEGSGEWGCGTGTGRGLPELVVTAPLQSLARPW